MIESRELRIGNKTNEGTVFEIKDKSARVRNNNRSSLVSYEDLFPIPLTEEMLLKCGFKNTDWGLVLITSNNTQIGLVGVSEQWSLGLSGPFGLVQPCFIKHLHQLQNIIYALTGEELEIKL